MPLSNDEDLAFETRLQFNPHRLSRSDKIKKPSLSDGADSSGPSSQPSTLPDSQSSPIKDASPILEL